MSGFSFRTLAVRSVAAGKTAKPFVAALCMTLAVAGLAVTPAYATLIEMDLNAAGDKLITRDTDTGLEWLDVTATLGLSFNQALATDFVTMQGFGPANSTQVSTLYTDAGVVDQSGTFIPANFDGVAQLLSKLGCTVSCGTNGPNQQGLALTDPVSATLLDAPLVALDMVNSPFTGFALTPNGTVSITLSDPAVAVYLLRAAARSIPEPATWPLVVSGLVLLAGFRLRRRSGKAGLGSYQ